MRIASSLGLAVLGVIVALLVFGSDRSIGQQPERPVTWEYKVHLADAHPPEDEFNALGKDGWELSLIVPRTNYVQVVYVFKRKRPK